MYKNDSMVLNIQFEFKMFKPDFEIDSMELKHTASEICSKSRFQIYSVEFKHTVSVQNVPNTQFQQPSDSFRLGCSKSFFVFLCVFNIDSFRKCVRSPCSKSTVSENASEVDVQNVQYQKSRPRLMFNIDSIRKRPRSRCSKSTV